MSIPKVSIRQIKAARALLGMSQRDLETASGVSLPTIKRLEAKEGEIGGRQTTVDAIVASLDRAGIHFLHDSDGGPGVQLKIPPHDS